MMLLDNVVQPYAWGSREAISGLLGLPTPSATPEAELWMGAHPAAPSKVLRGGAWRRLDEVIAEAPEALLGPEVAKRFGPRLPFLFKVLAAAEPLSLQAHPSIPDAERGFDDEERRGVPRTAPNRNYKDRNHKPELICAISPFEALYGFREPTKTLELLRALAVPQLGWAEELLAAQPNARGLRELFARLMSERDGRAGAIAETLEACNRYEGELSRSCGWALRMAKLYPGDPGIISSLLLNLVELRPGEALYLPAGNLHAYLDGVGVEIMASSDNVLRGGLTPKHVDVPELLRVLDFAPIPPAPLAPRKEDEEEVYDTPAPEFRLSRLAFSSAERTLAPRGPEILLVVEGELRLRRGDEELTLRKGQSVFIEAGAAPIRMSGTGAAFRAAVNTAG